MSWFSDLFAQAQAKKAAQGLLDLYKPQAIEIVRNVADTVSQEIQPNEGPLLLENKIRAALEKSDLPVLVKGPLQIAVFAAYTQYEKSRFVDTGRAGVFALSSRVQQAIEGARL